jgi:hypothetical protein
MTKKQRTGTAPEEQKETPSQGQSGQDAPIQGPSRTGSGQPLDRDPEEEGSAGRDPEAGR